VGTHFADLANWFMDSEPVRVLCSGQGVLNHAIIIHYAHGGMATVTMASTWDLGVSDLGVRLHFLAKRP